LVAFTITMHVFMNIMFRVSYTYRAAEVHRYMSRILIPPNIKSLIYEMDGKLITESLTLKNLN